jgi:carbamoyl-phosphate synthase large subunit
MSICYTTEELNKFVGHAFDASPHNTVLVDKFLEDAFEIDVDALSDGKSCIVAGIMQHVEEAGVHSGDSSCVLPTYRIESEHLEQIRDWTRKMATGLGIVGLMNTQYAVANNQLYVIEVNPRASRTVPYVSKATGVPLAKMATKLMLGKSLEELGLTKDLEVHSHFVKAPVFPFVKFPGIDPRLSPEMKSTGEVMGVSDNLGIAFYKAQLSAGVNLPKEGTVFITVNKRDHQDVVRTAKRFADMGFKLIATKGTARVLRENDLEVDEVLKRSEGRPNCVDSIKNGDVALVINTTLGASSFRDGWAIRTAAVQHDVPCITTLSGASAAAEAIFQLSQESEISVLSLQEIHS